MARAENISNNVEVSVILPVYNAGKWMEECLASVYAQTFPCQLELSVFNDGSTDRSMTILKEWAEKLEARDIKVTLGSHSGQPKGVGYAKNMAVLQSSGTYLCFLDADDVMNSHRVEKQLNFAKAVTDNYIIGCKFHRKPDNSTLRFAKWANNLTQSQLYTQIYTSHGPTVIMPTWFCHRKVFDRVKGFNDDGKGTPEDLLFFYDHILNQNGQITRVDIDLLMYRYHPEGTTFSVLEETIWNVRIEALQKHVLDKWHLFTIWNAGKQGRKFYRCLSEEHKQKVVAFCDVDHRKIQKGFYVYEESSRRPKPKIPIVHFSDAKKPFIICVKLDLSGGEFENNLQSLNLIEGVDYFHFN